MKFIALLVFAALSGSAWAAPHCNGVYVGQYFNSPGRVTFEIMETGNFDEIQVRAWYLGRMYVGNGRCNRRNIQFGFNAMGDWVTHSGRFMRAGRMHIDGMMYMNGRAYDRFNVGYVSEIGSR